MKKYMIFLAILITGCASIFGNKSEILVIKSIPDQAKITVINNETFTKVWEGTTPASIFVPNKYTYSVQVNKTGYKDAKISVKRRLDPWFYGNFLFYTGFFIPMLIDYGTGSMWKFRSNKVNVFLKNDETFSLSKNTSSEAIPEIHKIKPSISADIHSNIPLASEKNKHAIGVIIGNKDYSNQDVPNVDFALNDAQYMKKYLISTLGYDENNIIYIENASQTDFITIFGNKDNHKGKLYDWIQEGKSDVFVYYVGHGAPNPENKNGYFVPSNADPSRLDLSGYNLNLFYENLSKLEYKSLTVVLDACFSGVSEKGMLLKNVSPIMPKVKTSYLLKENTCIFTSASNTEVSSWYPEKNHSLFTYFFLKGIQGEADIDKNKIISSLELENYLSEKVTYFARRINSREQHPQLVRNNSFDIAKIR